MVCVHCVENDEQWRVLNGDPIPENYPRLQDAKEAARAHAEVVLRAGGNPSIGIGNRLIRFRVPYILAAAR